ncbi:MAG: DUF5305 domain-containing protein [Bacilli bacterium]|nr:DUF5305 domain-containing protein [Bacilli bacterium]
MKRNKVNEILSNQTKKRNTIVTYICAIILISILSLSFFLVYVERNKEHYVTYDEKSNIRYDVLLNQNDFFKDNYLANSNEYIASLINTITANFEYSLSLNEENVDYKYSYQIDADVIVKNVGTDNVIYNKTENVIDKKEYSTNEKLVTINEKITIDYNSYNDLIKKFIKVYSLEDVESTLTLNMYVNVVGSCEELGNSEKQSVMSLIIPLTTNTVAIDISNNLIDTENNVMQCEPINSNNFIFMVLGIIFVIVDIVLIVLTIRYDIKTRTAENIYERELKKILNNYRSYIQKVNNTLDLSNYRPLKVDTFTDMLEIRDTLQQPILMFENKNKNNVYFVIPSTTKILYIYALKVSDIEKEILKNSENKVEKEII